jgi:hypothetical protein
MDRGLIAAAPEGEVKAGLGPLAEGGDGGFVGGDADTEGDGDAVAAADGANGVEDVEFVGQGSVEGAAIEDGYVVVFAEFLKEAFKETDPPLRRRLTSAGWRRAGFR